MQKKINITKITIKDYNKIAEKFNKKYCQTIYFKKQVDEFISYLKPKSHILDVGCGTGHVAKYLNEKGFSVIGIDLSEEMLKIANKQASKSKFILMDQNKLNFENNSFDAIMNSFSLIHSTDTNFINSIKKYKELLKDNGFLFLGLIEGEDSEIIDEPLDKSEKIYFNYFNKKWVSDILVKNKFRILSVKKEYFEDESQTEFFVIAQKITE